VRWPASGGLFHFYRTIPNPYRKKPLFDKGLAEFRSLIRKISKSSRAQKGTKILAKIRLCSHTRSPADWGILIPSFGGSIPPTKQRTKANYDAFSLISYRIMSQKFPFVFAAASKLCRGLRAT
jgi:hypothetical protein